MIGGLRRGFTPGRFPPGLPLILSVWSAMPATATIVAILMAIDFFMPVCISAQHEKTTPPTERPVVGRSLVVSRLGIVATGQPLASAAGAQILERGGNAIDAAIAANAALGVMEPMSNGIGGDLFAIVYIAKERKVYGLNASGWAASGMTPAFLAAKGITTMPEVGIYSTTVPGAVAGWDAMRERFGSLPFATTLAPAIYYAEHGFPVSEVISGMWARSEGLLAAHPNAQATYLPGGHAPTLGDVFRNPDLARSLGRIAERGRVGFYEGATAEAILAMSRETGGRYSAADLADLRAEWVEPIKTTYRGWTVTELPPNGQGIAALMMLDIMERYPVGEYGFQSPKTMHVMIEAKKLAYADMLRYVGDPRFARVPVARMLDKAHAAERAHLIDVTRARCHAVPSEFVDVANMKGTDTIYMTVVDADGNIVSLIQSNYAGFGSGLVPPGSGFVLQNRGALFSLDPASPNVLAPRKRPLHTIIPAFLERGDVKIGFGIMGGWNQAQAHAQFVSNIADFGLTIQQALEAGRFTKKTFEGCDVEIEALVSDTTRVALSALGHVLQLAPPRSSTFGFGQAVMVDGGGTHYGASDPRHDGAAVPESPHIFP
ncbi:MAG: gamma-glutamyltransferase [Gemmatimonadaceae bacterium]